MPVSSPFRVKELEPKALSNMDTDDGRDDDGDDDDDDADNNKGGDRP